MLYLIIGGSGSGKSEYGEKISAENKIGRLFYIAAMKPYDNECIKRIERHRRMRAGKGFETIECHYNIGSLNFEENDTVLIECMSNLLANEMYDEKGKVKAERGDIIKLCESEIIAPVIKISKKCHCVVVVTNEIFSDGNLYDTQTEKYIEALGYINRRLASAACDVIEVVCSLPLRRRNV